MKYTTEVIINKPLKRVIELFDSTENLYKWQEGLQDFEHLSGEPGKEGSKAKLVFDINGRKIEMTETIVYRNFPREFHANFETTGVFNEQKNYFQETGENQTKWTSESYFKFSGIMKLMSFFMKSSFKKQTRTTMNAFKGFAESA